MDVAVVFGAGLPVAGWVPAAEPFDAEPPEPPEPEDPPELVRLTAADPSAPADDGPVVPFAGTAVFPGERIVSIDSEVPALQFTGPPPTAFQVAPVTWMSRVG